ncbi:MAG: hypothetical protein R2706_15750 [Acidimicrobiales bacterium]
MSGFAGLGVSDVEFERAGPTYTCDTIDRLAMADRHRLGADRWHRHRRWPLSWHDPERLAESCTLAVVNRFGKPGYGAAHFRYERW